MITLDVATAGFVLGVLVIALGLMFQGIGRVEKSFAPSRHWALAAIIRGIAFELIAFRANLPPLISIVLANTLTIIGISIRNRGIALYIGERPHNHFYVLMTLFIIISFSYFTFLSPNINSRIIIISISNILLQTDTLHQLRRSRRANETQVLFWIIAIDAVWSLFRALMTGLVQPHIDDFLKAGGFNAATFIVSAAADVLVIVAQYRLEAEQSRRELAITADQLRQARDRLEEVVAERTTALRDSNAELARLANHDPLTGLSNRRHFFELVDNHLAQSRRYHRPASVFMVDLDHFKRVNDNYGHGGGDETLRVVARCLRRSVREIDVVARFGGEEMAVFLPETTVQEACVVAERFRKALEACEILFEDTVIRVTASLGVAAWAEGEDGIDRALDRADAALYRVKNGGRNGVLADASRSPAGPSPG